MDTYCFELNPVLLGASHLEKKNMPVNCTSYAARTTQWHELDIITWGEGFDHVNGRTWPVTEGDIFYRTPGMYNQHDLPYTCYFFIFDAYFDKSHIPNYHPGALYAEAQNICPEPPIAPFSFAKAPYLGKARNLSKLCMMCREILMEYSSSHPDLLMLKILFLQLLREVSIQVAPVETSCTSLPNGQKYRQEIQELTDWIQAHPNSNISMQTAARKMGLSYSFFSRLFKNVTGENFNSYVTQVKLDYVKMQLIDTNKSVSEIAQESGFQDPNYLYTLFKRVIGCTPTDYRRKAAFNGPL